MKTILRRLMLTLAFAGVLTGSLWLYRDSVAARQARTAAKPERQARPLPVEVASVCSTWMQDEWSGVGVLQPVARVSVAAELAGLVTAVPFDVGDRLRKGDILLELDETEQQLALERARSSLEIAQTQWKAKQAAVRQVEKQLERLTELAASGVATEQQLSDAAAQLAILRAESDLEAARVRAAETDLAAARLGLERCRVRSPVDGFVAMRAVEAGDLVAPQQPVLELVDLRRVLVEVRVPEPDYVTLRVGQVARITVDALPGRHFDGTIARRAPVLDPETGTAPVIIEVDNPQFVLKPGMFAHVTVLREQRHVRRAVPVEAIVRRGGATYVFAVGGDPPVARQRRVKPGIRSSEVVEIRSGLHDVDRVVTLGSQLLRDGQAIQITRRIPCSGSAAPRQQPPKPVPELSE